jgi:hypothetical protein
MPYGELALEEASRKAHSEISCISNIRQVTVSIQHDSIIMYS